MSDAGRWLKVCEAADRARCGPKTIYRAVQSGELRAARIGGRRELRFLEAWVDTWLLSHEGVCEINTPRQAGMWANASPPADTQTASR